MSTIDARIGDAVLSLDALLAETERADCGALAVFVGVVRDHQDGRSVSHLVYTAHVGLAEKLIREIEVAVARDHDVPVCRVRHRMGHLDIGESAVIVVVRSAHRAEAFAASRAAIEAVKHRVPIWKEEFFTDGTSEFVPGCSLLDEEAVDHH
ncbi:MAG: molybdenum cofactor biosynthesis protein MoaE [Actinobacteria bacterium]|nr:molybdenum cofactor biosynthesis protein MoaE [Actinomycetota bacterium]